jgi:uncharacterized protein VirK/YbjX
MTEKDAWTWYRGKAYYLPQDMVKLSDDIAENKYRNPIRKKYEKLKIRAKRILGRDDT